MRLSEVLSEVGRPVAYYPGLVKHLGSINAVLFFCQIFYWQKKTDNSLGVYKVAEEIEEETGLTYREQATARKHLISRGILVETHKRLEHRIYFRINVDRLDELMSSADCGNDHSRNALLSSGELTNTHSDPTENTTKSTSESKPLSLDAGEADGECGEAQPAHDKPAVPDYRDAVSISLDWKPDPGRLKAYAAKAGVPFDMFTEDAIGLFTVHFEPSGLVRTQGQWEAALVTWVNRDRQNAAKAPRRGKAADLTRHSGFDDRDYTKGLTPRGDGTYDF